MQLCYILICDDHPLIVDGIRAMLGKATTYFKVDFVSDLDALHAHLTDTSPDLLILDINMAGVNSLDHVSIVKRRSPATKIIMFSSYSSNTFMRLAKEAGADGYLSKQTEQKEFNQAIQVVLRDQNYFPSLVEHAQVSTKSLPTEVVMLEGVSDREMQIIALISEGNNEQEIANTLYISYHTVKTHKKNIFRKLQVNGTNGLIKLLHKQREEW
jgi:DNA-binding NarL/FixJ family response regulator